MARTRARSTEASCSTRSRTAATFTSSELTGSVTSEVSRICSARSALTSGISILVIRNCGRSISVSRAEATAVSARVLRSNSEASVHAASRPATSGRPKLIARR